MKSVLSARQNSQIRKGMDISYRPTLLWIIDTSRYMFSPSGFPSSIYLINFLIGNQTLGEEYSEILQVDATRIIQPRMKVRIMTGIPFSFLWLMSI